MRVAGYSIVARFLDHLFFSFFFLDEISPPSNYSIAEWLRTPLLPFNAQDGWRRVAPVCVSVEEPSRLRHQDSFLNT